MLQQIVLCIQWAMVDHARVTAFALVNTRAMRRESYLSHLPHLFTSALKAQLQQSGVDSDLLFNVDSIDKAIGRAQQVALVLFTEGTAKALIKPKHKQGTLLVEKHPQPSTSADSFSQLGPSLANGSPLCTLTLIILLKLVVLLRDSPKSGHFENNSPSNDRGLPCLASGHLGGYGSRDLGSSGPMQWVQDSISLLSTIISVSSALSLLLDRFQVSQSSVIRSSSQQCRS